jgi:hypothetical protein
MCDFAVHFWLKSISLMSISVSINLKKFGSVKGHLHVRFCRAFLTLVYIFDDHFSVNQHEEALWC